MLYGVESKILQHKCLNAFIKIKTYTVIKYSRKKKFFQQTN